jgi:hypothetical protein
MKAPRGGEVATVLRWGAVAAGIISPQVWMLWWRCGRLTIALKCHRNRRKMNDPANHPQLWWIACPSPMRPTRWSGPWAAAGSRPSRDGSAGPPANHHDRGARGRRRIRFDGTCGSPLRGSRQQADFDRERKIARSHLLAIVGSTHSSR